MTHPALPPAPLMNGEPTGGPPAPEAPRREPGTVVRVLLAEADPREAGVLRAWLEGAGRGRFEVRWARDEREVREALAGGGADVCLVGDRLGPADGLALLREARGRGWSGPVIVLTGRGDPDADPDAFRAGADDCLVKGEVTPALLDRSVRYALERHRLAAGLEERVRERTAELARANAALRESEQQLRAVYEAAPVGICETDPAGRIVRVNPRFCALTGYPAERLLGRHFLDITHPADAPADADLFRRLVAGEVPSYALEKRYLQPDGHALWVSLTCSLVRGPGGGPAYAVRVAQDATARKLAEEALRAGHERLREEARRKDEFIAMLGHELRNPLGPVRNALEVLRMRGGDPAAAGWAAEVGQRQIGHMARMLDDLLDVSRLARGKVRLQAAPLDLAGLVRAAAQDHRPALEKARLELEVRVPDRPVWVTGDATRLAQIVGNLLANAVKFTDPGGRVSLCLDEAAGRAVVRVSDTGCGMEPEMLPRLFDAFSQEDRSLDRNRGGLGLGLALVRGLARLHGGGAEAHSDGPGKGSEFRVWLPLAGAPSPADRADPDGPAAGREGRLRVLVVEDNPDAAETLRALLALHGHEVAVAHTGPDGIEAARSWRPDVVLSDLGLPGADGFAVARAVRADPAAAGTALVAVSGYGRDRDKEQAREAGFDHHVTKPYDPDELVKLLTGLRRPAHPSTDGDGRG